MKVCAKCKQEKTITNFGIRIIKGVRKIHRDCKSCVAITSYESSRRRSKLNIFISSEPKQGSEVLGVEEGRQFKSPKDFIKFKKLKLELAEFKRGKR